MIFDPMYFVFMILASLHAQSTEHEEAIIRSIPRCGTRNVTGAQAARAVLDANGLQSVAIEPGPGRLTDHYDPRTRSFACHRASMASRPSPQSELPPT